MLGVSVTIAPSTIVELDLFAAEQQLSRDPPHLYVVQLYQVTVRCFDDDHLSIDLWQLNLVPKCLLLLNKFVE